MMASPGPTVRSLPCCLVHRPGFEQRQVQLVVTVAKQFPRAYDRQRRVAITTESDSGQLLLVQLGGESCPVPGRDVEAGVAAHNSSQNAGNLSRAGNACVLK